MNSYQFNHLKGSNGKARKISKSKRVRRMMHSFEESGTDRLRDVITLNYSIEEYNRRRMQDNSLES